MKHNLYVFCQCLTITLSLSISSPVYSGPYNDTAKLEEPSKRSIHPYLKWGLVGLGPTAVFGYGALAWWTSGMSRFHLNESEGLFGKSSYSGGSDKLGHLFASFYTAKSISNLMNRAGETKESAALWGGVSSTLAYTMVELFDGFDPGHGAGMWDMAFNVAGSSLSYLLAKKPWLYRVVTPRVHYLPSTLFKESIRKGDENPYNITEDYNGWKFYVDVNPMQYPPIHDFLLRNAFLDFFGHLLQFSMSFEAIGFKPQTNSPYLKTSLGLSVDVVSLLEFVERRLWSVDLSIPKKFFSHVRLLPMVSLYNTYTHYKRIGAVGQPTHLERR